MPSLSTTSSAHCICLAAVDTARSRRVPEEVSDVLRALSAAVAVKLPVAAGLSAWRPVLWGASTAMR